jgi:hypothetical protein
MVGKTYGFCLRRGMGYGLLRTYGLWYVIPCEPSWWTAQAMGYKGLWVMRGMGYEGFDCIWFWVLSYRLLPIIDQRHGVSVTTINASKHVLQTTNTIHYSPQAPLSETVLCRSHGLTLCRLRPMGINAQTLT